MLFRSHHRSDPQRRTAGRSHVHAAAANRRTELEEAARGVWRHPTRLDRGSIERLNLSPSHKTPEQPALLSGVRPCLSRPEKNLANWDTARPGRHDRTSSPGADLQKSHYLKFGPENFGGNAPTFGIWVGRAWAQRRESRHSGALPRFLPPRLYYRDWLAGELGFEPRQTESESVVLPLHHSPIDRGPDLTHGVSPADRCPNQQIDIAR